MLLSTLSCFLFGLLLPTVPVVFAQTTPCSASQPCTVGCCGNGGIANSAFICGTGPTFCGAGNCTANCGYKSECDPGWGIQWSNASTCPLNVCCSPFGFCGTTADFCGGQQVAEPSCATSGLSTSKRLIGYYEGWNVERSCDVMTPAQIPLGYYTHINFAFSLIDPNTFQLSPMDANTGSLYGNISSLKGNQPGLQAWLSVGGWSFNDPGPTQSTFSQLAGSESAQQAFFASLLTFMSQYGFDGVDIDWEYPAASDRSGSPADFTNYVSFLSNLRAAFVGAGRDYGISITLPSSYWYLQHFDIVNLSQVVDWFNLMTYDLHGVWDGSDPFIGAVALAHTNLTEIDEALQLMWRNHIDPAKVTMGLGFYGRSFTMSSSSCLQAGCPFSGPGKPGPCTASAGTLSAEEIRQVIANNGATVTEDPVAAVEIVTWDGDQWVSYDDLKTFQAKVDYANSHCVGGLMVWAADLDDLQGTSVKQLAAAMGLQAQPTFSGVVQETGYPGLY
ncbi:chitinase [Diplogelasinospora grovesii]|uniref:chitinase n=1 Tax=Diplogelasinospora grovesii TaxID=303347 RepID=A0AAN6S0Q7_9PEZI|nr:chitinase [Diplogelasinospora grovesii]